MKPVGKQLQEARLAKNWTPEMAARETKIKVDRVRDLEADDYSHFTSPTYARGFVRTYARLLGLDEYKILRQLDNKLPDDDSANIVTDTGVAYVPETSLPPRAAHRDFTGLYIVMALGGVVAMVSAFVIFKAYQVGELSRYFASNTEPSATASTNGAPVSPTADTTPRALPVDSNTPPPIADTTPRALPVDSNTPPPIADTSPRALPVDSNTPPPIADAPPRALPVDSHSQPPIVTSGPEPTPNPSPAVPEHALRALPVDPSELATASSSGPSVGASSTATQQPAPHVTPIAPAPESVTPSPPPPRALPVDPSELNSAPPMATATVALNTSPPVNGTHGTDETTGISPPPVTPPAPPTPIRSSSARQSNTGPVMEPSLPAVAPSSVPVDTPPAAPVDSIPDGQKRLVLTASQDSFVRVTSLDSSDADKPLYAAVLHNGQSVGFDGRKFSINVGIPSAVDIKLDGVNYGPHSDQDAPETFTVQSHLP